MVRSLAMTMTLQEKHIENIIKDLVTSRTWQGEGRIQGGGGVLEVRTSPFRGSPNFVKLKKTLRACAQCNGFSR